MKIGILSRNENLYSTKRLVQACIQRGHEVEVIDTLSCYMNITANNPKIHYKGRTLDEFDAIIPRIGSDVTFYGASVVRQFEMMNVYSLNKSIAITRSRDKLRSMQILAGHNVNLPITGFASSPDDIEDLIAMVGGAPLVIKLLEGTQGLGVVLAETNKAAESVLHAFMELKANILVQEYVKESNGADIRCFVIGDRVVASIRRQAKEGEFRSNLHRGGTASLVKITDQEKEIAIQAAKVLGLNVAGVDILQSNKGPVVLEVNSSPGLEGIETISKIDIASKIIQYIEKNAAKMTKKRKNNL
ncbi:30S ribosomal protein S6--L-glutamate ligase [Halarcobacter ebronensis]|uniref:Probable alpha-L-glutamate ligase n=1 Tax=Halarcobacter ebronensis TaxID=1462615 RepID=A0A4Q0YH64_9BACT|nr:30S ribosomal protein S6--L-glutamate ligase [Halarcobacter ebronensis]RXJ69673.1 30S ribosomal protein S6--L-glutamate ligase [Halarcobacter ebronensis]